MTQNRRRSGYEYVKRFLDVSLALLVLLLTLPVLAVLAVLVRCAMGRPMLFRQIRPGRFGMPFVLVKFRTMRVPDRPTGPADDAARLTRFGRILRATSLDELPTLWNVVRGDMSLVGPRPLLLRYLRHYTPAQARRHAVRPGVTGLAQVRGRNAISWEQRFEYDLRYVENRSLRLDAKILFETVSTVVSRRGISAEGHATMPEFAPVTREGVPAR